MFHIFSSLLILRKNLCLSNRPVYEECSLWCSLWIFSNTLMVQYDCHHIRKTYIIIIIWIHCGRLVFLAIEENVLSKTVEAYYIALVRWSIDTIKHKIASLVDSSEPTWYLCTSNSLNDFIRVKTTHDLWVIILRVHLTIFKGACSSQEVNFRFQINVQLPRRFSIVYDIKYFQGILIVIIL